MKTIDIIKVFIASPGDVLEERKLFPDALAKLNKLKAKSLGYLLEPSGWEDALPSGGRPQKTINKDVEDCDVFVMLMWTKWGTPSSLSKKFSSGTEEEFSIAFKRFTRTGSPHLLLYFRSVPQKQMADQEEDLSKIIAFRTRFDLDKTVFYKVYDSSEQWEELLLEHLALVLDRRVSGVANSTPPSTDVASAEINKMKIQLQELQNAIEKSNSQLKTTQSNLRVAAIGYAVEASKLLAAGKLALAEGKFAKSVELYEEPEVLNEYGLFLFQIGSLDRARERFEKVVSLPSGTDTDAHRARAYKMLGNIQLVWGKFPQAEIMFKHAIAIARQLKDEKAHSDFLGSLGHVYIERGNIAMAERAYLKSLKIAEKEDDKNIMMKAYISLGNTYVERKNLKKAQAAFEKVLEIAGELKHKEGMENGYLGLGNVFLRQKRNDDAEAMYKKALKLASALKHKAGLERAHGNLGNLYLERGDLVKAKKMYEKTLEFAFDLGHRGGIADTYGNLGCVYQLQGHLTQAKTMWTLALEIFRELKISQGVKSVRALLDSLKKPIPQKAAKAKQRPNRRSSAKPVSSRPYRPRASKR